MCIQWLALWRPLRRAQRSVVAYPPWGSGSMHSNTLYSTMSTVTVDDGTSSSSYMYSTGTVCISQLPPYQPESTVSVGKEKKALEPGKDRRASEPCSLPVSAAGERAACRTSRTARAPQPSGALWGSCDPRSTLPIAVQHSRRLSRGMQRSEQNAKRVARGMQK